MAAPSTAANTREKVRDIRRVSRALQRARLRGGQRLSLAHEVVDHLDAGAPEVRVGEVDADQAAQLVGRVRPARRQQLEVVGHERRALLLVRRVDGEGAEVAYGVRATG